MTPTVLMLGWEYPPAINGGLGIASLGLAEALSSRINLHMLLPQSGPLPANSHISFIDLNQWKEGDLWDTGEGPYVERMQDLRLSYVDIPLSGYEYVNPEVQEAVLTPELPARFYELKQLYGKDLPKKIVDYSEMSLRLANDLDFDLIHAHDWMTFPAALEIQRKSGKRLILHVHSLCYDRVGPETDNWVYQLEKKAFESADLVVAVSHYTADIIRSHYHIPEKKIQTVHNAFEPLVKRPVERSFPDKLISFIGRMTWQKGPEYFFDAAMKVLAQRDGVRFVLAGEGDMMKNIMDMAAKAHIGDKFHFTGFISRDKIRDLLVMTDVLLMPSRSEPFGLVALEAAQLGIPCVIPYQSGATEILLHTPKFQAGDTETMAQQLLKLMDDKVYRAEIVQKNLSAVKELSWDRSAEHFMNLYQQYL